MSRQRVRGLRLKLCGRMGIQEQPSPSLHHPAGKVYKCREHVGRAQSNNLKEAAKKTEFSEDMKTKYQTKFPKLKL